MAATVLVVDDHPSFRRFARRLLEAAGYRVVDEAADGAEALAAVRSLRPEIVLLDVLLPDTTGPELAALLAAEPVPPLVVLTSSRNASDLGSSVHGTNARGFISKRELTAASFATLVGDAA
jgi:two-component system nitrate/nitrite response regulator NarL